MVRLSGQKTDSRLDIFVHWRSMIAQRVGVSTVSSSSDILEFALFDPVSLRQALVRNLRTLFRPLRGQVLRLENSRLWKNENFLRILSCINRLRGEGAQILVFEQRWVRHLQRLSSDCRLRANLKILAVCRSRTFSQSASSFLCVRNPIFTQLQQIVAQSFQRLLGGYHEAPILTQDIFSFLSTSCASPAQWPPLTTQSQRTHLSIHLVQQSAQPSKRMDS